MTLVLRRACLVELNSGAKYQLGLPVELLHGVAGNGEARVNAGDSKFFFFLIWEKKKVLKASKTPGDRK